MQNYILAYEFKRKTLPFVDLYMTSIDKKSVIIKTIPFCCLQTCKLLFRGDTFACKLKVLMSLLQLIVLACFFFFFNTNLDKQRR